MKSPVDRGQLLISDRLNISPPSFQEERMQNKTFEGRLGRISPPTSNSTLSTCLTLTCCFQENRWRRGKVGEQEDGGRLVTSVRGWSCQVAHWTSAQHTHKHTPDDKKTQFM